MLESPLQAVTSIEELKSLSEIYRKESEEKRRDIRGTVGEGYRSLVLAAESVISMEESAKTLVNSIDKMSIDANKFQREESSNKGIKESSQEENEFHSGRPYWETAALMKLFTDIPEVIWSYLDDQPIRCALLWLLARKVHVRLMYELSYVEDNRFPVLERNSEALGNYQTLVLTSVKSKLKMEESSLEDGLNACAAILLLNVYEFPKGFFEEVLKIRTERLNSILINQSLSAKVYVVKVTDLILKTLELCDAIFQKGELLKIISEEKSPFEFLSTRMTLVSKYLGDEIKIYRHDPLDSLKKPMKLNNLNEKLHGWLDEIHDLVVTKTDEIVLSHVSSVEGLAQVRSHVLQRLSSSTSDVDIWEEFFKKVFCSRAEGVIRENIRDTATSFKSSICQSSYVDGFDETWTHEKLENRTTGFSSLIRRLVKEFYKNISERFRDALTYISTDQTSLSDEEEILESLNLALHESINEIIIGQSKNLESKKEYYFYGRLFQFMALDNFSFLPPKLMQEKEILSSILMKEAENCLDACLSTIVSEITWPEVVPNQEFYLKFIPRWESTSITETSDDGNALESIMSLPKVPSWILIHFIRTLCDDLYARSTHSLPGNVLDKFFKKMAEAVVQFYAKAESFLPKIPQNVALQFLFDLRVIYQALIPGESTHLASKVNEICKKFEGHIDPFDLDAFSEKFSKAVKAYAVSIHSTNGVLIPEGKSLVLNSMKNSTSISTTEHHTINFLQNKSHRFKLLPEQRGYKVKRNY